MNQPWSRYYWRAEFLEKTQGLSRELQLYALPALASWTRDFLPPKKSARVSGAWTSAELSSRSARKRKKDFDCRLTCTSRTSTRLSPGWRNHNPSTLTTTKTKTAEACMWATFVWSFLGSDGSSEWRTSATLFVKIKQRTDAVAYTDKILINLMIGFVA